MTRVVLVLAAGAAALALLFVSISPAPATRPADREKSLKIFIVCDSEGGSGIVEYWSRNVPPSNPRFQEYRELMTRDINAAIEGCFQAGATEVVVSDDGFGGTCTVPELMDSRASWIRGPGFGTGKLPLLAGLDESFDGLMLIGFHPMEGAEKVGLRGELLRRFFVDAPVSVRLEVEAERSQQRKWRSRDPRSSPSLPGLRRWGVDSC